MGGLAGLVQFDGAAPDPAAVGRMAERLAHRGPDGQGRFGEGPVALAHHRRAVRAVPIAQPHVEPDVVVMLDGWLYDHGALAAEVGVDETASEIAALAAAWRAWGRDALPRLEGEFAVAIWDREAQQLALARDPMGTRPLFWARSGNRVAFASELPALLAVDWIDRALAPERVAEYLSFQVVHAPRTLVRQVEQVEPGCVVQVGDGWAQARRYWRPRFAAPGAPAPADEEVVEQLRQGLAKAVRRRTPEGVPAGLYLSGGLGSTAIAAASAASGRPIETFTVAFEDDRFPESPYAGRVARLLELEQHEVTVDTSGLAGAFDEAVRALGHPVGHPAVVLQLLLARAARAHVRVVLSGNGGEALLGGRQLEGLARDLRIAAMVAPLPSVLTRPLDRMLSGPTRRFGTPPERYAIDLGLGGADLFSVDERRRLLREARWVRPDVRQDVLAPWYLDLGTDPINTVLYGHLRSTLGERALPRVDRTAAASGLDVRYPLLDPGIVSLAASLPGLAKVRRTGGRLRSRWPLRELLVGQLPAALLDRPKRSLPTPLGTWLSGPGRLFMERRFRLLQEDPQGLWNPGALDTLRKDVARSNAAGIRLWTLFILDAWMRSLTA